MRTTLALLLSLLLGVTAGRISAQREQAAPVEPGLPDVRAQIDRAVREAVARALREVGVGQTEHRPALPPRDAREPDPAPRALRPPQDSREDTQEGRVRYSLAGRVLI